MVLDVQPNDILPEVSSSPTTSTVISERHQPQPSATIVQPSHNLMDLQTVSIKLPPSMAVLVVPVHLSSVMQDDSMQLQQIGRRVAIIRGSMTNVAEFQVLPAMNLDENSRVVDTDIRQIVSNSGTENPENGPTIQIIPNATELVNSECEVVDEVITPPPPKPKPKTYLYIEGIHCGRCYKDFNDLVTLAAHQKSVHNNMRTIDASQIPETKDPDECQASLEAAQIEDKIAARGLMGRATRRAALALKKMPTKRAATGGTRNNTTKGGGPKRNAQAIKAELVFTCHYCSLTFMDEDFYKTHLETHQAEAGDPMEEFMEEFVEEEEEVNASQDVKSMKKKVIKTPKYTISTPTTRDEKHPEGMGPTEHIITDSSGNQIMVHANTPEELQELLASLEGGSELVLEHHQEEAEEQHVMIEGGQMFVITESVSGAGIKAEKSANRGR